MFKKDFIGNIGQILQDFETIPSGNVISHSGSIPILITSVHGFSHVRDWQVKNMDAGSLELSYLIARLSGSYWMAVWTPNIIDSNHHKNTDFKNELATFIKENGIQYVIDIHTSHAFRPFDVDIGSLDHSTLLGKTELLEHLTEGIEKFNFMVGDNSTFKWEWMTTYAETIVRFCMNNNVPSAQLEVSSAYTAELDSRIAQHARMKLICGIISAINKLSGNA